MATAVSGATIVPAAGLRDHLALLDVSLGISLTSTQAAVLELGFSLSLRSTGDVGHLDLLGLLGRLGDGDVHTRARSAFSPASGN